MVFSSRLFGGILLVSGTSIGAGMLALPVITSFGGFFPSLFLLGICWFFLFLTSLLLLDVNLFYAPEEINLITMSSRFFGLPGKAVTWVCYLLLLYSLTAAYIAGSTPIFLKALAFFVGESPPEWVGLTPLLLVFGFFVYLGTKVVDWVNRFLMIGLALSYFLILAFLPSHMNTHLLMHVNTKAMWIAVPVLITSYGFHIIIPTLSGYLKFDRKKLRWVLFIGSLIPFLVYSIWEMLILGVVPQEGLSLAYAKGLSATVPLSSILQNPWMSSISNAFSFFAILTSFLGVSLSLSDFLTDGLHMKRFSLGRELACLLTFAPPLVFVLFYPKAFIVALQFAGIFVAILLCILPALMAWRLPSYQSLKRKFFLFCILFLSSSIIILDVLEELGILQKLAS